jgi:hypothetical protein
MQASGLTKVTEVSNSDVDENRFPNLESFNNKISSEAKKRIVVYFHRFFYQICKYC